MQLSTPPRNTLSLRECTRKGEAVVVDGWLLAISIEIR
jgi:hypothetical protein